MIRIIFVLALFALGLVRPQNTNKPNEVKDIDSLIIELFNTNLPLTPDSLPPGVPEVNTCPNGECVPYHLCENGTFVINGEGIIDIRFDAEQPIQCHDYLETCCGEEDRVEPTTPIPFISQPRCGQRNLLGLTVRISGDDNASKYGEFPWMAAISQEQTLNGKTQNVYQCGGSLIHPGVVLTAAHCTFDKPVDTLRIRLGEWDTQTENEQIQHQNRRTKDVIIHPNYNPRNLFNDIALIFLDEPVELVESIQTVCLPPHNTMFDHSRCTATGWGKNEYGREGKYQSILKKIDLPVVPQATCQTQLRTTRLGRRFILHSSFLCAGGERGKDTCRGDGGSPLICPVFGTQNRYYQSGIVAWGIGCGDHQVPGVYVNVAQYKDWIDEIFNQRNLDKSFYTYQ